MTRLRAVAVNLSQESGRSVEVIEYGLKSGLYSAAAFLGVTGVGWAAGVLPQAMAAYVASGTVRMAAGGGHTTTPVRCIILTSVQFGLVGFVGYHAGPLLAGPPLQAFAAGVLLFLLYAVLRFAPRDTPNKPISRARGRRFKRWAVIVWAFWAAVIVWTQMADVSAALVFPVLLGLGVQGLTLVSGAPRKQCEGR